ncbi:hypothetical protein AB28_4159 [Raoultella ornithinolytica 2-156-04_S1_C2]|nr:hypothetical protein AB00_4162 [Raoultella ornithinolytica 2-156-04_S1_C1]KDX11550.1 hypothetical protein AB28_4159 [Raoultella ornithinolytica 2-156-04_S1_C2]
MNDPYSLRSEAAGLSLARSFPALCLLIFCKNTTRVGLLIFFRWRGCGRRGASFKAI